MTKTLTAGELREQLEHVDPEAKVIFATWDDYNDEPQTLYLSGFELIDEKTLDLTFEYDD